jgi:hypothetical protein
MKAKQFLFGFATLVLMTLTFASCNKDSSSSGSGLNLKIAGANPTYNIPVQSGNPGPLISSNPYVRWDTAIMVVSMVAAAVDKAANPQNGDPNEPVYYWYGPKTINLFASNSSLGLIPIPPGYYQEVEIKIFGNKADAGDKPVLYLSGIYYNSGGMKIPMIVEITDDVVLKAEKKNVTVNPNAIHHQSGMIQLALDELFSAILPHNLDLIIPSTGKIIISSTSNIALYNQMLKQLALIASIDFDH